MAYRIEADSIGTKEVPVEAYYGVQSMRGTENFQITGQKMQPEFINSMAEIKRNRMGGSDTSLCMEMDRC